MELKTATFVEGGTRLVVPAESLRADPPPTAPVFFNPAAALNRDVSVAVAASAKGSTFCDSLAGVGARGVRVAKEAGLRCTLVDFNDKALKLGARSAALNHVVRKCKFVVSESAAHLASRYGKDERYDFVDVDPFGSPAPFMAAALRAVAPGGILSLTATDSAVLCGVYPEVSRRRYLAEPLNNKFTHETGVRILLGAACRLGGTLDIGVVPLLAHATRHYFRVYLGVEPGATKADRALRSVGHVVWGPGCGHLSVRDEAQKKCASCGRRAESAGPLWTGKLTDTTLVAAASKESRKRGFAGAAKTIEGLLKVDRFPPWSFSLEEVSSSLGVASVPKERVVDFLEAQGFTCGVQPFEKEGLKTDASYDDVVKAARESVRARQS